MFFYSIFQILLKAPIVQIEIKKHKKPTYMIQKIKFGYFFKLQVHDWAPYLYREKITYS